jgi:hypothetical protein
VADLRSECLAVLKSESVVVLIGIRTVDESLTHFSPVASKESLLALLSHRQKFFLPIRMADTNNSAPDNRENHAIQLTRIYLLFPAVLNCRMVGPTKNET